MQRTMLFMLFIIPLTVFSQINHIDSNGLQQGQWEKRYPNGRLMYEGTFRDGKPEGEWIRYHEGGQVKARINYDEASDSTFAKLYDNLGNMVAEGTYINEKRVGKWQFYSGNVKISEDEFTNGIKHGIARTYYPTGELLEESEWQNGQQDGNYRVFFKNGNPFLQCKYSQGRRNGLCLSYFQNGRVEMEAYYQNNLRNNEWKFYSESGEYLYSLKYDRGKLLNPEVRDSIDNLQIKEIEKGRNSVTDPEKFMNDPSEYMMQMQKFR
jgi:antitoxin component YwqK of YwqJK toxin-antitoxin module